MKLKVDIIRKKKKKGKLSKMIHLYLELEDQSLPEMEMYQANQ